MIKANKLTNTMYGFSGRLFGFTTDDVTTLEKQVESDLRTNLSDIVELNINLEFEPVEDIRTLHSCHIAQVQMLITFKAKVAQYEVVWIITNYLEHLLDPI